MAWMCRVANAPGPVGIVCDSRGGTNMGARWFAGQPGRAREPGARCTHRFETGIGSSTGRRRAGVIRVSPKESLVRSSWWCAELQEWVCCPTRAVTGGRRSAVCFWRCRIGKCGCFKEWNGEPAVKGAQPGRRRTQTSQRSGQSNGRGRERGVSARERAWGETQERKSVQRKALSRW